MTDPDSRPVDWASVFASAHRRVVLRLGVAAAIGAAGAALLLGGGGATRAAIQTDDGGSPGGGETEQAYLTLTAGLVDGGEEAGEGEGEDDEAEPEAGAAVEFSVVDEGEIEADAFAVVATTSSGETTELPFPPLAAHETATGSFDCPVGDVLTIEIESAQPHDAAIEVRCEEGGAGEPDEVEPPTSEPPPSEPPVEPPPTEPPAPEEEPF